MALHKIIDLDEGSLQGTCEACQRVVDIYPNGEDRQGVMRYRCGPAVRAYQRKKYERANPDARRYNRHPLESDQA